MKRLIIEICIVLAAITAIVLYQKQVNNLKNQKSELIKSVGEQIFGSIVNGNC